MPSIHGIHGIHGIRITCIIDESRVADAVRALHKVFELEQAQ